MSETTKWAILGTGMIARTFAGALAKSETGDLIAVGSRALASSNAFGKEFGVPRCYPTYEHVLADPDIDAVYISLPNHLHLEWGVRCAKAKKHILCEKPLTLNHSEAISLINAVRSNGVFMMESFMYRCHPQTAKTVELIREGAIGDVRIIQAEFGYNMSGRAGDPYENIRLRNDVGGGSIMDVGCYAVSACRLMAGAALQRDGTLEPEEIRGLAHIGDRGRVDEWALAVLRFPNDILANVTVGSLVAVGTVFRAWGSEGFLEVPNPWFPGRAKEHETIVLQRTGKEREEIKVPACNGLLYTLEADILARHKQDGQAPSPCMTWNDSLGNMRTLDRWRESIG
ncbi:MAG: Gfo/Idh/MocA family oxidoreductase, partial [Lentisphaerae bacterium]|nr:Gfo/Idh/MocA family oxidoreductase [Lentisphaerota bacterium]